MTDDYATAERLAIKCESGIPEAEAREQMKRENAETNSSRVPTAQGQAENGKRVREVRQPGRLHGVDTGVCRNAESQGKG